MKNLFKNKYLIGTVISLVFASILIVLIRKKMGNESDGISIIIGDSQTPLIASQSKKAKLLGSVGSEENLWKGGMGLSWLKQAVDNYPSINKAIKNIFINIGTNGGFNPKDNADGLIDSLKIKFPKAKLFMVQGSWGWGNNKDITTDRVKNYYDKFSDTTIIDPPIGSVSNPHINLPIYKEIGKEIDNQIK